MFHHKPTMPASQEEAQEYLNKQISDTLTQAKLHQSKKLNLSHYYVYFSDEKKQQSGFCVLDIRGVFDFFDENKKAPVELLDLSHNYLKDDSASFIAFIIITAPHLALLNLSNNGLTSTGITEIQSLVALHPKKNKITHLDLGHNHLDDSAAPSVAKLLCNFPHLTSLDLSNNSFTGEGIQIILEAISNNKHHVEILNLANNKLDPRKDKGRDKDILLTFLMKYSFLKELNLSGNNIDDLTAQGILFILSKKKSQISVLKLQNNLITDHIFSLESKTELEPETFKSYFQNNLKRHFQNNLQNLDLSHNAISELSVFQFLIYCPNLKHFNFDYTLTGHLNSKKLTELRKEAKLLEKNEGKEMSQKKEKKTKLDAESEKKMQAIMAEQKEQASKKFLNKSSSFSDSDESEDQVVTNKKPSAFIPWSPTDEQQKIIEDLISDTEENDDEEENKKTKGRRKSF